MAPPTYANLINHRLDHLFDRWVALHVARLKPDMVICYENAALWTFRAAKKVRAVCVLDAASVHFSTGARLLGSTVGPISSWINQQKDEEIKLADGILVCSQLALDSYAAGGVAPSKLHLCELGVDVPPAGLKAKTPADQCRFIFVGSLSRLKGVDVLLDAFEGLRRDGAPAVLTLVGGVPERDLAARAREMTGVNLIPFMEKSALYRLLAGHDCLVLPSRLDSFGLVVPEAMSVGVPVLVSDRVGAKSLVDRHPGSGWVVPFDPMAIRDEMRRLANHPDELARASLAAREAVREFSSSAYRTRVVDVLRNIVADRSGSWPRP
jgi:glycosyltransferase involved in cell wall biosynthesis